MINMDTVFILGKQGCDACIKAKEYFQSRNVPYIYTEFAKLDVDSKRDIIRMLKDITEESIGYPLIYINGYWFFGFNPLTFDQIINVQEEEL